MIKNTKNIKSIINKAGGVFVTGTDTDVGKTVVSACLINALEGNYWKPIQSGLFSRTDTEEIYRLVNNDKMESIPPVYELSEPLSPHESARRDGVRISLKNFYFSKSQAPLVVEGAGGVMVPLNKKKFVIDLIVKLKLPIILVARSSLGTINHTLLSLAALRKRNCRVLGVIMNGEHNQVNIDAIETYGKTSVIFEMLPIKRLNAKTLVYASNHLKKTLEGPIPWKTQRK